LNRYAEIEFTGFSIYRHTASPDEAAEMPCSLAALATLNSHYYVSQPAPLER